MTEREDAIARATEALGERLPGPVDVLVTLGSGLGAVAERLEDAVDVPVSEVPGLAVSTVPGHAATLRYGRLGRHVVLAQRGRVHLYEGHDAATVVRTVEVAAGLGARTYVVTNAAGGLDPSFTPGDLMLITDHLNLTGRSPLTGVLRDGAPVFLDLAGAYDARLAALAHEAAADLGIRLQQGVYAGLTGPAYETPAEVRMLRTLGAHAVGMSTVLEVIAARANGLDVVGLSSITNVHGEGVATSHEEVIEVGADAAVSLGALLLELLGRLPG